jgi:D-alanyl-D-alanine endopeptidase (penicillin-binding protein 7)
VRRLVRPDSQTLNWKAAVPVLGLVAACLSMYVHAASRPAIDTAAFAVRPPMVDFASCAKPNYPAQDIAASHEGTVTLGFDIDGQGRIVRSRVDQSSGYASMDVAALNAIRLCQFQPGMQNGKPISSPMKMQYVWTLK